MKLTFKDILAVAIALVALAGVALMFMAEGQVVPDTFDYQTQVLPSLQKYCWALGSVFVAVSVAYILLGRQNDIATIVDEPDAKK